MACEAENIVPYIAKTDTAGKRAKGEFPRSALRYLPEDDEYECPAGARLIYRFTNHEKGEVGKYGHRNESAGAVLQHEAGDQPTGSAEDH
jgi:hypothetical protein